MHFTPNSVCVQMKYVMYPHGGSGNHGCEAIVRTTVNLLGEDAGLYSSRPSQDVEVGLNKICRVELAEQPIGRGGLVYFKALLKSKFLGRKDAFDEAVFRQVLKGTKLADCFLSIGGDNYCYGHNRFIYLVNRMIDRKGIPRILWGSSVEPDSIDGLMLSDLNGYKKIWARESLTYEALLAGSRALSPEVSHALMA